MVGNHPSNKSQVGASSSTNEIGKPHQPNKAATRKANQQLNQPPHISPRQKRKVQSTPKEVQPPQRPQRSPSAQRKNLKQQSIEEIIPKRSPRMHRKTYGKSDDEQLPMCQENKPPVKYDPMPRPTPLILPDNSASSQNDKTTVNTSKSNLPPDGWVCPRCTLVNKRDRPGCEACANERPSMIEHTITTDSSTHQQVRCYITNYIYNYCIILLIKSLILVCSVVLLK